MRTVHCKRSQEKFLCLTQKIPINLSGAKVIVQAQAAENSKNPKTAKAKPNKTTPTQPSKAASGKLCTWVQRPASQYMNDSNQHQLESEIRQRRQNKSGQQSCDALHRTIYYARGSKARKRLAGQKRVIQHAHECGHECKSRFEHSPFLFFCRAGVRSLAFFGGSIFWSVLESNPGCFFSPESNTKTKANCKSDEPYLRGGQSSAP